ncbi:transcription initiation factor TFIID subunit 12 [Drosophila mojavensis]|uniref:DUF4794 domain-containing protein n=1 Tax=Drosophila mojavensis TaxID=7230 RepID=B4KQN9_DROMO|nr:transcription initiation factor TFIID subunit 12 [Drosophila mojavensis]EDW08208.1 uncharacterized protein Dmoj_GI19837 [Drosophila mojavensis]
MLIDRVWLLLLLAGPIWAQYSAYYPNPWPPSQAPTGYSPYSPYSAYRPYYQTNYDRSTWEYYNYLYFLALQRYNLYYQNLANQATTTTTTASPPTSTTPTPTTSTAIPTSTGTPTTSTAIPTSTGTPTTSTAIPTSTGTATTSTAIPTSTVTPTTSTAIPTSTVTPTTSTAIPTSTVTPTTSTAVPTTPSTGTTVNAIPTRRFHPINYGNGYYANDDDLYDPAAALGNDDDAHTSLIFEPDRQFVHLTDKNGEPLILIAPNQKPLRRPVGATQPGYTYYKSQPQANQFIPSLTPVN